MLIIHNLSLQRAFFKIKSDYFSSFLSTPIFSGAGYGAVPTAKLIVKDMDSWNYYKCRQRGRDSSGHFQGKMNFASRMAGETCAIAGSGRGAYLRRENIRDTA